jgi:hypothetical protein
MPLPLVIGAALAAAPGIIGMFQKTKKTPQEREAEALAAQARDYTNLMMNPDDPRYKAMVTQEQQGLKQNYLGNLRDVIEANRRQAIMGRQQFFDPERRDESMFSGVLDAQNQAQNQAGLNVLQRLQQSISGLQGQQSTMLGLADLEAKRREQRRQAMLGGLSGLSAGINAYNAPKTPKTPGALS